MNSTLSPIRAPQLDDVVGHDATIAKLCRFVKRPKPSAFLFHGDSGSGKTMTAYALARALGVAVDQEEFGGLRVVASGTMDGAAVRDVYQWAHYRPMLGSGWKAIIANECDRMTPAAEVVWLDALERLPPMTVVCFTTNEAHKLSERFMDRCTIFRFGLKGAAELAAAREIVRRRLDAAGCDGGNADAVLREQLSAVDDEDEVLCSFRVLVRKLDELLDDDTARKAIRG